MRFPLRFGAFIAFLAVTSLPLLAGTRIVHRWVLTGQPMPQVRKLLVAGVFENYLTRVEFEDEMKRLLAKYAVEGVQSYLVLPPKNEMMENELKQRIKESSLDGVLVIRLKAVRSESEAPVTRGPYVPPPGYYSFWPYWNAAYVDFHPASASPKGNFLARVEFNLFYTKDEKLIWSGETAPLYSRNFEKLDKEYAKTLVGQLKKDKLIGKK